MMDRLAELSIFLAVADQGGFTRAARALRTSPPTVTRIVANLEQRLGIKLFDRTSRRCSLTEQGSRFVEQARSIVADYEKATSRLADEASAPRGTIRVTAPYFFGREHVAPSALRFLALHHSIRVELDLNDDVIDLHESGIDLAVRIGPISDETLQATRVGGVKRVIVASSDYLAANGTPRNPAQLQGHLKIQNGVHSAAPWRLSGPRGRTQLVQVAARFAVNQADAALAAARAGHGLVTALSYQVHDDLRSGRLVRVLAEYEPPTLPVSLTWPQGRDQLLRIRMIIDHLTPELRRLPVISEH